MKNRAIQRGDGFTLTEVLIAAALSGVVFAVAFSIFFALQRGFLLATTWSAARVDQVRLLDSLSLDLRNSGTVSAVASGSFSVLPITMKIPIRYSSYETSGFRAGDPASGATALVDGSFNLLQKLSYTGSIGVTYRSGTASDGTMFVTREAELPGGALATRTVASFPASMSIQFQSEAGTAISGSTKQVVIIVSATGAVIPGSGSRITPLRDAPYLREAQRK